MNQTCSNTSTPLRRWRAVVPAATALALALSLAGCASGPKREGAASGKSATPDASQLETLAVQRWEHLISGNFGQAWEFFSPGYQATKTKEQYAAEMAGRPVKWLGATYEDRDCPEPTRCTVRVKVDYRIKMAVTGVGEVKSHQWVRESWLFLDGRWVYLPPEAVR